MMHHVLKSSVSLQWLSEVFCKIWSYVNVYIFWLGKEESTKNLSFIFQIPQMKAAYLSWRGSLKSESTWEKSPSWPLELVQPPSLSSTWARRGRGSCRDEPTEEWSWQNSCSHRSSGNWWILITLSEYLRSFHSGPSLPFAYWLFSPIASIFAFPFFHLPPNIPPPG